LDVPGWQETAEGLIRTFEFDDFSEAFGFISRVALVAETQQHHPDWSNSYGSVHIRLRTHDAGNKVTAKDYELAIAINALL
tara:strand:- start:251 stop:493 length:243 start_codon:yes stop_codon:yes gene_type:complete